MSVIDDIMKANERYAATFQKEHISHIPRKGVAIITCMDARIDPNRILGFVEGDAHVLRNAGGRVTPDMLRSLIISQQLLETNIVVVIHHTSCGMLAPSNQDIQKRITDHLKADVSHIDFLPFKDLEQSVRDDLTIIKNDPLIPEGIALHGFIYDVYSGKLLPVAMDK